MNWVGGARSRIRQQADRRKQREFFERKRLQSKVKKVIRPKSPREGSSRGISKDLLYLQAVSKAHDGTTDGMDEPPYHVKKLKLTGPRSIWPERNLVLPMSPIGKPSALDLHDATCDRELPSLFATHGAPRVSTQKIPHHTVLNSFGPQKKDGFCISRPTLNPPAENTSLLTDEPAVFSRRVPAKFDQSSALMNESLGLEKEGFAGRQCNRRMRPSEKKFGQRHVSRLDFPDRNTKRRPLIAEKSYDHETPFSFGDHPLNGKELPRTKASLLDFHISENRAKQNSRTNGKEKPPKEGTNRQFVWPMDHKDPALPTGRAVEPRDAAVDQWDSLRPQKEARSTTTNTTLSSSAFDENPLSRKAAPTSCSTVFNESILGPIRRHTTCKQRTFPRQSPPQEPSTTEWEDKQGGHGDNNMQSAFERMMSAFDKAVAKPIQPQQNGDVAECVDQLPSNEGASNVERGVTLFGNVDGKPEDTREVYSSQSKKWKDFISGFTEQSKPVYTTAHKQWQEFINGKHDQLSTSSNRVPDDSGDQQKKSQTLPVSEGSCSSNPMSCHTTVEKSTSRRLASISVMDELMCLEEIGSVGLGSDAVMASQEISFTPVVSSRRVPDIDTCNFSAQRCMSENPLKFCHTLTQPSPCSTDSVGTGCKESQEESESVGMVAEQILAHSSSEPTDVCAEKCCYEIKLHCGLHDEELEKSVSSVDVIQGGEGATSNEIVLENMNGETESDSKCSPTADIEHRAIAIENMPPTTVKYISQLQVNESCQRETVKNNCNGDPPAQNDLFPTVPQTNPTPQIHSSILNGVVQTDQVWRNSVGCAVQCSLLPSQELTSSMSEKSTQTCIVMHADTAVQVVMDRSCHPKEPKYSTAAEDCHHIQQTANEHMKGQLMETTDDVAALRRELDCMQNTVIWQALMLRMYGMH